MIDYKAQVNEVSQYGNSCLGLYIHLSDEVDDPDVVKCLLRAGFDTGLLDFKQLKKVMTCMNEVKNESKVEVKTVEIKS